MRHSPGARRRAIRARRRAVDALIGGDGWEPVVDPILRPLFEAAGEGGDLAALRGRLPVLLARMKDADLIEALRRLTFAGLLNGADDG